MTYIDGPIDLELTVSKVVTWAFESGPETLL
jgi:hypothetical protein